MRARQGDRIVVSGRFRRVETPLSDCVVARGGEEEVAAGEDDRTYLEEGAVSYSKQQQPAQTEEQSLPDRLV